MRRRSVLVCSSLIILAAAMGGGLASAHHGGAVEWGEEDLGPITGVVKEFAFRFPHVQVVADMQAEGGGTQTWTLVTRWTPTILRRQGWSRESIQPGDTIEVTYRPHVESPMVGAIQSIEVNGAALPLGGQ